MGNEPFNIINWAMSLVCNDWDDIVLHYLNTGGEIWNGEDVPAPDDPLYVSIIDEIMEADGVFQGTPIEGEP